VHAGTQDKPPVGAAVGSLNPTKVGAARTVMARLGCDRVEGVAVPSGVPEQPIGWDETRRGAEQRARLAQAGLGARYGIGMEGGVLFTDAGEAWLMGIAVLIGPDGHVHTGYGPRLLLPPAAADALRGGAELGPVIDGLSGLSEAKTGVGAIGWLTGNLVAREQSWVVALACAAAPLFHPGLYGVADPDPGATIVARTGRGVSDDPGGSTVTNVPY
jgi:inosine/xanthosine triphosphatase